MITIIDVVRRERRTTLRVHVEVELATAPVMRERLLEVLQEGPEEVVVDLAKVTFLDVVTVGVLEQAAAAACHRHISLILTRVPGQVLRILDLTASDLTIRDNGEGDL